MNRPNIELIAYIYILLYISKNIMNCVLYTLYIIYIYIYKIEIIYNLEIKTILYLICNRTYGFVGVYGGTFYARRTVDLLKTVNVNINITCIWKD